ncbi:MAG TPA: alpha/beta hydrolase [Propionicimonas sp.]|uniref:alpha/beta hydrolase n=1 Tax=Propionicimonas sp. TaxID=1955623 RepID=UPI002F3F993A
MHPDLGESHSWPLWPVADGARQPTDRTDFTFDDPSAPVHDRVIVEVSRPRVLAYAPKVPNGNAVLVLAGGGYTQLVVGKEGVEVAEWLCSLGFHAFVLVHRFPTARSGSQAPVDDAIEAIRQIRARAAEFGVQPDGIGVCGLSSGGHLAACLVSRYPASWSAPPSAHADVSMRPAFVIVGYAPISTNASGRTVIADKPPLPPPEKQALYEAMQPDAHLLDAPPPTFIVYGANDSVVPVENAYRLHQALHAKGGAAELHVFADAPHGFALREQSLPVGTWPALCAQWLASAVL